MQEPVSLKKVNSILLLFVLITVILFYGRQILIPLAFSIILAMLMTPVSNWLEEKGFTRIWASVASVMVIVLAAFLILLIVIAEVRTVSEDWQQINDKLIKFGQATQVYVEKHLGLPAKKQLQILQTQTKSSISKVGSMARTIITGFTGFATSSILTLVFIYLLLYQREKYKQFFLYIYKGDNPDKAVEVLNKIGKVAQNYLVGKMLSIIFLTVLYFIGLIIIGIKGAFILSAIAALLTIVPYVGTIIGGLLPVFITLITEPSYQPALYVFAVMVGVQAIDNYFIEPYVVGGEVNLSGLSTILILAVGGFIWGVAGMILFIPILGIVKIIFDNVDALKPYGYLIGDQKKSKPSTQLWSWIKNFGKSSK